MNQLTNPIFTDETKAREWLEARIWPEGPICPHCGEFENVRRMEGDTHRAGLLQCNGCRKQFTVTVGTLFERSKIPLTKWLLATFLLSASKKRHLDASAASHVGRQLQVDLVYDAPHP